MKSFEHIKDNIPASLVPHKYALRTSIYLKDAISFAHIPVLPEHAIAYWV